MQEDAACPGDMGGCLSTSGMLNTLRMQEDAACPGDMGGCLSTPGMLNTLRMQGSWVPWGCRGMPEHTRDAGCPGDAGGCLSTPETYRDGECHRDAVMLGASGMQGDA